MDRSQPLGNQTSSPDPSEREEDLELQHLRGAAARFEVDSSELRRLVDDLDQLEAAILCIEESRSLLEKLADRLLPATRSSRQVLLSTINVLRMNLGEIARLTDAQRSADERQLLDLLDALVERLADIDVLHSRLEALEQERSDGDQ